MLILCYVVKEDVPVAGWLVLRVQDWVVESSQDHSVMHDQLGLVTMVRFRILQV